MIEGVLLGTSGDIIEFHMDVIKEARVLWAISALDATILILSFMLELSQGIVFLAFYLRIVSARTTIIGHRNCYDEK
jgi:hypothetical protein